LRLARLALWLARLEAAVGVAHARRGFSAATASWASTRQPSTPTSASDARPVRIATGPFRFARRSLASNYIGSDVAGRSPAAFLGAAAPLSTAASFATFMGRFWRWPRVLFGRLIDHPRPSGARFSGAALRFRRPGGDAWMFPLDDGFDEHSQPLCARSRPNTSFGTSVRWSSGDPQRAREAARPTEHSVSRSRGVSAPRHVGHFRRGCRR
jgi:hypothetical protein